MKSFFALTVLCGSTVFNLSAAAIVFSDAGATAADITDTRDAFRAAIGGGTVAGPAGSFGGVRREINWDAVGAASRDPMPGDLFSIRGVILSGTGRLVVSGDPGTPQFLFDDLTTYDSTETFTVFSAPRLFAIADGPPVTALTIDFVVPGTGNPAYTTAFGSIFTHVESELSASIAYYSGTQLLRTDIVPGSPEPGLSFLGAVFTGGEQITRVIINLGNGGLNYPDCGSCGVPMDDFLYAEPLAVQAEAVPEPASLLLIGAGFTAIAWLRCRKT